MGVLSLPRDLTACDGNIHANENQNIHRINIVVAIVHVAFVQSEAPTWHLRRMCGYSCACTQLYAAEISN